MNSPDDFAFPGESDRQYHRGMTMLAYLIAHAPAEPWPEFMPKHFDMKEPVEPILVPVGNDGKAPNEATKKALLNWKRDPCWEAGEEYPTYSFWVGGWCEYWKSLPLWREHVALRRRIEWPRYWAERMIEELAR